MTLAENHLLKESAFDDLRMLLEQHEPDTERIRSAMREIAQSDHDDHEGVIREATALRDRFSNASEVWGLLDDFIEHLERRQDELDQRNWDDDRYLAYDGEDEDED